MSLQIVILAAGKGSRMRSSLPKVLHKVSNKPMVSHVIDAADQINASKINIVYGFGGDALLQSIHEDRFNFVEQVEQLGTGHAVKVALSNIPDEDSVMVLYGDVPLIQPATLSKLKDAKTSNGLALLTVHLDNPAGYGRIIRNAGQVEGIVEQKDATEEALLIQECNTGILIYNGGDLKRWLDKLSNNNAQGEFYLTDIVTMAHSEGVSINTVQPEHRVEVEGANDPEQLASLNRAHEELFATTE